MDRLIALFAVATVQGRAAASACRCGHHGATCDPTAATVFAFALLVRRDLAGWLPTYRTF